MTNTFKRFSIQHLPKEIQNIVHVFKKKRADVYLVGGCIRDWIMRRPISDYDLSTDALPEDVLGFFPKAIPTGIEFGTVAIPTQALGNIEITTLRKDGVYRNHRHPQEVSFTHNVSEDLARRDFTVNAMAMNLLTNEFLDPFDGLRDIERAMLKCVGNPDERFSEDALRMLRAARFVSTLGFAAHDDVTGAIQRQIAGLRHVSRERIFHEMQKLVLGKGISQAIDFLNESHLLQEYFPFFISKINSPLESFFPANPEKETPKARDSYAFWLRFAAYCDPSAYSHARQWLESQPISKTNKALWSKGFQMLENPRAFSQKRAAKWVSWARRCDKNAFVSLCERVWWMIHELKGSGAKEKRENFARFLHDIRESNHPIHVSDLKVDGNDLLKLGVPANHLGKVLNDLLEQAFADPTLNQKDKLLNLLKRQT